MGASEWKKKKAILMRVPSLIHLGEISQKMLLSSIMILTPERELKLNVLLKSKKKIGMAAEFS